MDQPKNSVDPVRRRRRRRGGMAAPPESLAPTAPVIVETAGILAAQAALDASPPPPAPMMAEQEQVHVQPPSQQPALVARAVDAEARSALDAALDRVAGDVRILLGLARSVALPTASRMNLAEQIAEEHLRALRACIANFAGEIAGES